MLKEEVSLVEEICRRIVREEIARAAKGSAKAPVVGPTFGPGAGVSPTKVEDKK
jgi:hypothetical protein